MPSFKMPSAEERPYKFSANPEEEKMYTEFSDSIWKYKGAVAKIASTADIKQIELARISKETAREKLDALTEYFKSIGNTDIPENFRVLINVYGSINDQYDAKLE